MVSQTPDLRRGIVDLLQLLSSPDRQRDYERTVPMASVPAELLCMWFEDQYLPESPSFRLCFSPPELEAMAVFSNYFAEHEKLLPDTPNGIQSWMETETWQNIMQEAGRVLAALES
jgi:hypothetical protein